jgi:hypothetical protein
MSRSNVRGVLMSDWTPTLAALIAVVYFMLFPGQFKELLAWVERMF